MMFPPWVLTLEWKLFVSFTIFKLESTDFFAKICSFWQNPWILSGFCGFWGKIHPKSMDFAKIDRFHRILQSWGLGLWSSKVFQTKDQLENLPLLTDTFCKHFQSYPFWWNDKMCDNALRFPPLCPCLVKCTCMACISLLLKCIFHFAESTYIMRFNFKRPYNEHLLTFSSLTKPRFSRAICTILRRNMVNFKMLCINISSETKRWFFANHLYYLETWLFYVSISRGI